MNLFLTKTLNQRGDYLNDETLEYGLRKLERQNEAILDELHELKDKLPNLYLSKEVYSHDLADIERRIKDLESTNDRAFWGLLAGAGSLIFTLGKALLGL